jgi:hypothetical protein
LQRQREVVVAEMQQRQVYRERLRAAAAAMTAARAAADVEALGSGDEL